MVFNKKSEGFISSNYHGNDNSYLYTTKDQGKTWENFVVEPPKNLNYSYVNGYSPYFIGDDGFMMIEYVSEHPSYIVYSSFDGGSSWKPGGKIKIDSPTIEGIIGYSFCDKDTIYLVEDTGNLFKR